MSWFFWKSPPPPPSREDVKRKMDVVAKQVEARILQLEGRIDACKRDAYQALQMNNRMKAKFCLRQRVVIEKYLQQIQMYFLVIQQQILSLENMQVFEQGIMVTASVNRVVKGMQERVNYQKVMDDHRDLMDQMEEIDSEFSSLSEANFDEQALEDELNSLLMMDVPEPPEKTNEEGTEEWGTRKILIEQ